MDIKEFSTGALFVKTYCFVSEKNNLVVIDPGGAERELLDYMRSVKPEKVAIILTHGHFDHCAGVAGILEEFPNAEIFIHKDDSHYLGEAGLDTHRRSFQSIGLGRYIQHYIQRFKAFPAPTRLLNEGDVVCGLKVIHTPGHTPGSICLYSNEASTLFSGDTLFYRSRGRTDLYDGDEGELLKSLKRLFEILPENTIVLSGHTYPTKIGEEKRAQANYL